MKNNKCHSECRYEAKNGIFANLTSGAIGLCKEFKKSIVITALALFALAWIGKDLPGYNFEPLIRTNEHVSATFRGAGFMANDCSGRELRNELILEKDCTILLNPAALANKLFFANVVGGLLLLAGVLAHSTKEKPSIACSPIKAKKNSKPKGGKK